MGDGITTNAISIYDKTASLRETYRAILEDAVHVEDPELRHRLVTNATSLLPNIDSVSVQASTIVALANSPRFHLRQRVVWNGEGFEVIGIFWDFDAWGIVYNLWGESGAFSDVRERELEVCNV